MMSEDITASMIREMMHIRAKYEGKIKGYFLVLKVDDDFYATTAYWEWPKDDRAGLVGALTIESHKMVQNGIEMDAVGS